MFAYLHIDLFQTFLHTDLSAGNGAMDKYKAKLDNHMKIK